MRPIAWTRVFYTRVYLDACIFTHVHMLPRVINTHGQLLFFSKYILKKKVVLCSFKKKKKKKNSLFY